MKKAVLVAAVTMLFATVATAATSSGTLTVTGTVESSINLTIESAGGTTSGLGTAAATSALGNINKYGSAPTGFTLARGASDWTLSSTVGVLGGGASAGGAGAAFTVIRAESDAEPPGPVAVAM